MDNKTLDRLQGRKLAYEIADQIEFNRDIYDQTSWGEPLDESGEGRTPWGVVEVVIENCETPACVAGTACRLRKDEVDQNLTVMEAARELLELTAKESRWLFNANRNEDFMPEVLRHYAETGHLHEVGEECPTS